VKCPDSDQLMDEAMFEMVEWSKSDDAPNQQPSIGINSLEMQSINQ